MKTLSFSSPVFVLIAKLKIQVSAHTAAQTDMTEYIRRLV